MFSKRARADLALIFCTVIWGATFILVKDALADISVMVYIAVRFGLAAAVMGILFWRSLPQIRLGAVWAGAQIGFFMLGGYIFQTEGLKFTTASKAAFITGSSVILVPLLLAAFGRRRITSWIWLGALSALAGLYFLTVPPEGFGGLDRGDPIVFVCSVMFALHIIFVGRYIEHHSVGALSFLQVATTAILSTILVPLFGVAGWEQPRLHWTGELIFAILITSIGSTVIGFSFQVWAQQYASASHTAILMSLEPVFAAITAWIVAHERLGARALGGAALIFAGILLAELKGPAPAAPESPEPVVQPAGQ
ncbi:MAG TPA: DMT family transporter [Candidatus Acidoferrales bacterium]|nr:DMT family transporter [Candidatus Acidoferrales bacterium]